MQSNSKLKTSYNSKIKSKFQSEPVDRKSIQKIIDAGRTTPSLVRDQAWNMYVVTNKKDIQEFSDAIWKVASKHILKMGLRALASSAVSTLKLSTVVNIIREKDPVFNEAPVVIFITAEKNNAWAPLEIGLCVQNMTLMADSLGLKSSQVDFAKYVEQTKIYPMLHIGDSEKVMLAFIVGYGSETSNATKRAVKDVAYL